MIRGDSLELSFPFILTTRESYEIIKDILAEISKMTSKGYLNTIDLTTFPIFNRLVMELTDTKAYINGSKSMVTYGWLYNIIIIKLYELSIELKTNLEVEGTVETDIYIDLINLCKQLFNSLDPSIRKHLQKRGISIVQNIQTGFDTEFVNKDSIHNTLLSVQMASNIQSYIQIPKTTDYELSSLNPLTNETYLMDKSDSNIDFDKIEKIIRESINRIRFLRFHSIDHSMECIASVLKNLSGVQYFEKDGSYVFRLPTTPIHQFIKFIGSDGYTFKEIINLTNLISSSDLEKSYTSILNLLQLIHQKDPVDPCYFSNLFDTDNLKTYGPDDLPAQEISVSLDKTFTRKYHNTISTDKISITKIRNNVFIGHLTSADLSILNDFNEFKDFLDIVNKNFVTLAKPFLYGGSRVIIRDTMLLAPSLQKSLSSIGKLYDLSKIELSKDEIQNMDKLMLSQKEKFIEYALRDALITLTHACWMEQFNFYLKGVGIPLTLSGLGIRYVKNQWLLKDYKGYQLSSDYLIGDSSRVQTPMGLQAVGDIGLKLGLFIKNYKGGRNESFMYGIDVQTIWYDYDLTSAYTTVLYKIGDPNYANGKTLTVTELLNMKDDELLFSFTIIKCSFKFPKDIKYPSIPVAINEQITIYPRTGEAVLTGAEYIIARNQNCVFVIEEIFSIPFTESIYPFKEVIKDIQAKRRLYPKGTISNLLYKEIGNSIYGSLVRGMSDKRKYDNKTKGQIKIPPILLSNPILASWVTAFIRSIIGECLHAVQKLGGVVVSVTTDGFITNIPDLEHQMKDFYLLTIFKKLRKEISGDDEGLELKHDGKGIISWTTRGQLGIESNIRATTGFQNRNYTQSELVTLFSKILCSKDKTLEYIQSSLRSALTITKKGGHVTMTYKDQKFSLRYDNRRLIIDNSVVMNPYSDISKLPIIDQEPVEGNTVLEESKGTLEIRNFSLEQSKNTFENYVNSFDKSSDDDIDNIKKFLLLDSMPIEDALMGKNLRYISSKHRITEYNQRTSTTNLNSYRNYSDLAIRNFVKCLLMNPSLFPTISDDLDTYEKIIAFIHSYDPKYRISKSSISNLKHRKLIFKQVPRTVETLQFCDFVKLHYKDFDDGLLFQQS